MPKEASPQSSPEGNGEENEAIVDELLGIFFGDREKARDFVGKVRVMKDTDICQYVRTLVKEKTVSELSCRTDLWKVLNNHGIYTKTLRNWTSQVS